MHELLEQQIQKLSELLQQRPPCLLEFLQEVDETYRQADFERQRLERSLQVTSSEVLDGNLELLRDLERRKRLELQLRETENKWLSLMQASPSLILTLDREDAIVSANRGFAGCRPEEMVGQALLAFLPEEHQPTAHQALEQARSCGTAASFQTCCDGPTGTTAFYDVQVTPISASGKFVGLTVIATDTSERIRAVEALRRSEEQLRTMFENSPTGIVVADPDGTIQSCNPAFCALLDRDAAGLGGQRLVDFVHPPDREVALEELRALTRGERNVARLEMRFGRTDGTCAWGRTSLTLVRDSKDVPHRLYAMVEDVTGQKRAALERHEMEIQLRQAQKLEAIGQLAAGIAHEINTPTQFIGDNLMFLRRAVEMLLPVLDACARAVETRDQVTLAPELSEIDAALKKGRWDFLSQQVPRAVEQSLEGVERVSRIVRAMKEFAHPSGAERTPIDLRHAIENTITVARNEWKYVADVTTEFDPALPEVACYGDELKQVVLNLIINAAHAIAPVVADRPDRKGRITIRTRNAGSFAEIQVADDGTGIPENIRSRIFDPFFTTKEVGRGTGQGLALAHAVVVKKHGGSIEFESEVGVGTTFFIRLPIDPGAPAESEERAA